MIDLTKQTGKDCRIWLFKSTHNTLVLQIIDGVVDGAKPGTSDIFIVCYGASQIPSIPFWKIRRLRKRRVDNFLTMIWDEGTGVCVRCNAASCTFEMPDQAIFWRDGFVWSGTDACLLAGDDALADTRD